MSTTAIVSKFFSVTIERCNSLISVAITRLPGAQPDNFAFDGHGVIPCNTSISVGVDKLSK